MSLRVKIQRALYDLLNVTCDVVTYGNDGKPVLNPTPAQASPMILVNEIGTGFSVDGNYGRAVVSRKQDWTFEAILEFPTEVDLSALEDALAENPPTIAPVAGEHRQVRVLYSGMAVEHPTTKSPTKGTRAELRFEAVLGRP